MKGRLLSSLILILLLLACKKNSQNCGLNCTPQEELLFQTGFTNTVLTNQKYAKVTFSGLDSALLSNSNWEDFENHSNIGLVEISYEDGNDQERICSIEEDPDSIGNRVMKFQVFEPHIDAGAKEKGRVQLNLSQNNCIREIYQTVRLRLHPDMAFLMDWEERVPWLSLFEFWNNADWTNEKFPFRVTVNLFKIGS